MFPYVQFDAITKRFPGLTAVDAVSLGIARGECHGIVGENGAGKSTLGKILAGIYLPDEGRLLLDGKPVRFHGPGDALAAGVAIVHQELAFCENLSVAENLLLGRVPTRLGWVDRWRMRDQAFAQLQAVGCEVDPEARLGALPVGQQQMIQIAAAIARGARMIIFDEPTSSLSRVESDRLLDLIRRLKAGGTTMVFVSHRLEEVFAVCDTVSVMRDGRHVETRPAVAWTEAALVESMIGRSLAAYFPAHSELAPGAERLRVESLSSPGRFRDISFSLRAGEVLGLAGLVGSGRTEVAEAIFGMDDQVQGTVILDGREERIRNPGRAMRLGVGLVPEDRKRHGLVLSMTIRENLTLPRPENVSRCGWLLRAKESALAEKFMGRLRIKARGADDGVAGLSGGNQQKVVLSKWLAAQCRILILDEPTRGVDVGGKAEIHALIDELAGEGVAILLISSELPEIINLSTRVIVFRNGRMAGEVARRDATQAGLLRLMAGVETAA